MHMPTGARSTPTFNEQNIAALRKIMGSGPLQLWPGLDRSSPSAVTFASAKRKARPREGASHVDAFAERSARRAAVLVPLCNRDGVASVLFTVRTSKVSTHKGQVSFPGGHVEPGEDVVDAALRETREEIGDSIGSVEVLGVCQTLPAVTGTPVTPVLGYLPQDMGPLLPDLTLNADEVESVFTLSVDELLDPAHRVMEDLGLRGHAPAFTAGPRKVWGLTAIIADGVLKGGITPAVDECASHQPPEDRGRTEGILTGRPPSSLL